MSSKRRKAIRSAGLRSEAHTHTHGEIPETSALSKIKMPMLNEHARVVFHVTVKRTSLRTSPSLSACDHRKPSPRG